MPFEVHRVAEYVLGLTLVFLPFHLGPAVVGAAAAGALMLGLAATTKGRLGMLRWCSLRVHRAFDLAAVALVALLPLVPGMGGWLGAVFIEPVAAVMALLAMRTDYRAPQVAPTSASRSASTPAVEAGARSLGRLAGRLSVAMAPTKPADPAPGGAAPQAGGVGDATAGDGTSGVPTPEDRAARIGRVAGRLVVTARAGRRKEPR